MIPALPQVPRVRTPDFKKLLVAVALTAVVVNSAWAAEGSVSLRRDAEITGDSVTVGDVFAGVAHDADYVLAPAPGYGKTLVLNAADLQRISETFDLGWTPENGHEQVVVRRNTHEINAYVAADAVQRALLARAKGQKFQVEIPEGLVEQALPADVPATAGAEDLSYDVARGSFSAVIVAPAGSNHPVFRQLVSGKIYPLASLPVLKHAMRAGDVISASDIDFIDMRQADVAGSTLVDEAKIIGRSPRNGLAALRPIETTDLVPPLWVHKGDIVTMELKSRGMFLTVQGKALDNGAEGDTVQVQNTASSQVIQAVVKGQKTVAVPAPVPDGT
jgi:flagella basal body P-ring formation protein FlgA